ncbi:hypothetical protein BAOM_1918 [Peribacillus asahii]|uniref:Uncharacterized protein n=1 Tax=Peribacillus asahii TaxID=228899 RepID=A0A3Q9RLU5_9BACI|nr:hypothetical protein BAOM_1918 [Peribacillus asahii]
MPFIKFCYMMLLFLASFVRDLLQKTRFSFVSWSEAKTNQT